MSTIEPVERHGGAVGRRSAGRRRGSHGAAAADTDRAARLDCRPLADRRRRHYDLPRRADGRSGDDGGRPRRAIGSRRSDAKSPSRSGRCPAATSKRTCAPPSRWRAALPASPTSAPTAKRNRNGSSNRGSAPVCRSNELPIPRMIVVKLASGAIAGFFRLARGACRTGAQRQPRRSPRLDRSHARHGGGRGRGRHRHS